MSDDRIMTVSLRVRPEAEAAFNDFYHHTYLPKLLDVCPEFTAARRYEEFGTKGSLAWFAKRFWTLYQIKQGTTDEQVEAALKRSGREQERDQWKQFTQGDVHDVQRVIWEQTYEHPRQTWDGHWGSRPFFVVMVENDVSEEKAASFRQWYEMQYLPKIMADVPTWAAVRRYSSINLPVQRHMTIYESNDASSLERSFELMRAPWRYASNADWDRWVGDAITWQDATSFQPIYRRPG